MDPMNVEAAADALVTARATYRPIAPFTQAYPTLDGEWGYSVQALDRSRRLAGGEQIVGAKLGLTSVAKQRTMQVHQPIAGFLTDAMIVAPDSVLDMSTFIQPRFEPEVAFVLSRDLRAPLDMSTVAAWVESIAVAAEIIDSRYAGYRFAHADVVADNTSAAGFVVGSERHRFSDVDDLAAVQCELQVDGAVVDRASGAAILGHPLQSLIWLSEHVAARDEVVPAGSIVMAGAMTDAVPLSKGSVFRAELTGFGAVEIHASGTPAWSPPS